MPIPLALMAAPAAIQGATSLAQFIAARKAQKGLGERPDYEIPEPAKQALGISQRLASSYEMPGAGARRYSQDLQNQRFVAAALQAGNSQDAMAMLTKGLEGAQMGELDYSLQSAQNYQQRQQDLQQALGTYAGYEDMKSADELTAFNEESDRIAKLKGAALENMIGAAQGIGQMGMMSMMYGGAGAGTKGSMADAFTKSSDLPSSFDHSNMSGKDLIKFMMQDRQAPPTAGAPASRATQGTYSPSFGLGNRRGKNPGMWDETFPGLYSGLGMDSFSIPNLKKSGGYGLNNFNSGFFNNDLTNPVY
jgi:hypothetical protein